jgi:SAM-dependent methyltransferase
MKTDFELKQIVKDKYGAIAVKTDELGCCCGCGVDTIDYSVMSEDYSHKEGYVADADLSLGCGSPTEFANIKKGDTVLDLGSGAGNDCFIATMLVGESGKVIGLDMTEEMIKKAFKNKEKTGIKNVDFILGDINNIPLDDNSIDVIISNCVLNLVPDKQKAFSEMYRVLKTGGRFAVSDIVLTGDLPERIRNAAEMYAGCVSGAIKDELYFNHIKEQGFINLNVTKSKPITLPNELLRDYLNDEEMSLYQKFGTPLKSITVYAEKM